MPWLKNKETQTSWLSLETLILKENKRHRYSHTNIIKKYIDNKIIFPK
jgi:hypothetical protein